MGTDYLSMVREDGYALKDVPNELITKDICMAAIKQNGNAIFYVPEEAIEHICSDMAAEEDREWFAELCMAAVKNGDDAIRWVPKPFWTEELCLAAVKYDGAALNWIRDQKFLTFDVCLEAVRNYPDAIGHVPDSIRDDVMRALHYNAATRRAINECCG